MTDHDRFEEFVKTTIHELDPMPDVPREEMWARIEQARRFRRTTPKRDIRAVWISVGVGLAAMLAVGIGLGRWTAASNVADEPVAATSPAPRTPRIAEVDDGTTRAVVNVPLNERIAMNNAREERRQPETAASNSNNTAYQLVAMQHLTRAEVLLTSIESGEVDTQITSWAKDMLTTTRLLLDSPAADDPRMATLLEDLELILAQIASPSASSQAELDLIQQGIRQTDVLPRLRATVPAGAVIGI